jgi:hypothetical protein
VIHRAHFRKLPRLPEELVGFDKSDVRLLFFPGAERQCPPALDKLRPHIPRTLWRLLPHLTGTEREVLTKCTLAAEPFPLAALAVPLGLGRSAPHRAEQTLIDKLLRTLSASAKDELPRGKPAMPDFERLREGDRRRTAEAKSRSLVETEGLTEQQVDWRRREAYYRHLIEPENTRHLTLEEAAAEAGETVKPLPKAHRQEWVKILAGTHARVRLPDADDFVLDGSAAPEGDRAEPILKPRVPSQDEHLMKAAEALFGPHIREYFRRETRWHQKRDIEPVIIAIMVWYGLPQSIAQVGQDLPASLYAARDAALDSLWAPRDLQAVIESLPISPFRWSDDCSALSGRTKELLREALRDAAPVKLDPVLERWTTAYCRERAVRDVLLVACAVEQVKKSGPLVLRPKRSRH